MYIQRGPNHIASNHLQIHAARRTSMFLSSEGNSVLNGRNCIIMKILGYNSTCSSISVWVSNCSGYAVLQNKKINSNTLYITCITTFRTRVYAISRKNCEIYVNFGQNCIVIQ